MKKSADSKSKATKKVLEDIEVLPKKSAKALHDIDYTKEVEPSEIVIEATAKKASDEEVTSTDLVVLDNLPTTKPSAKDPLTQYLREISKYELLSREQEEALTKALVETGDVNIAKRLVTANLRLVVKIAMEYRSAHQNVMDLIQEGNIGLMKAVSKYDGTKGAKLSYYASWWIKSYILKFILDNFRLVKIGTTNEQKKLFFNLMREKERLESLGITPDTKAISKSLGVSEKAVALMDHRLSSAGGEVSIDTPVSDEGGATFSDFLKDNTAGVDEKIEHLHDLEILKANLGNFLATLKERDREVFEKRLLSEVPLSLQAIANEYGVSRERVRQIEARLLKNLRVYMSEFMR